MTAVKVVVTAAALAVVVAAVLTFGLSRLVAGVDAMAGEHDDY